MYCVGKTFQSESCFEYIMRLQMKIFHLFALLPSDFSHNFSLTCPTFIYIISLLCLLFSFYFHFHIYFLLSLKLRNCIKLLLRRYGGRYGTKKPRRKYIRYDSPFLHHFGSHRLFLIVLFWFLSQIEIIVIIYNVSWESEYITRGWHQLS